MLNHAHGDIEIGYSVDHKGYMNYKEGLIMNGRYRLQKRIGKGTFSKVFAAHDLQTDQWVALKVVRNTEKYKMAAKVELHILEMIVDKDPNHQSNCIHLLDNFNFQDHPCFVFDLLGRNLYAFLHANKYMPFALSHIQSFIRQILQGIAFLHHRQVIFTDLKPENIVFVYDQTLKKKIHDIVVEIPKDTRIQIIDFGSALYADRHHTHLVQTRHYRAPEVILGIPWHKPIDIWSVGCIIIELLTGRMVFNTHDSIDHLNQIQRLIGKMPDNLKRQASNFEELFHPDYRLKLEHARISPAQSHSLDKYFSQLIKSHPHLAHLYDLCSQMLRWYPESRISAAKALQHQYFKN